jgi:hypothetical protein
MSSRPENTFAHTNFHALVETDKQIAHLKDGAYSKPVSAERFNIAKAGLESKGFKVTVAEDKDDAFEKLKTLIPDVSSDPSLIPNSLMPYLFPVGDLCTFF